MKKFINTRMILIMETLYILIFIILGSRINQYSSFTILSMISIVSFVLSVIGMKNKDKLKLLLLIISTIFIYLQRGHSSSYKIILTFSDKVTELDKNNDTIYI